jgi:hypothetical protein
MNAAIINARILASFIQENLDFSLQTPCDCLYCKHIGALFTDAILQSGVNYKNVVLPRVCHILRNYPDIYTVSRFYDLLETEGAERVLMWNHKLKINRIYDLIDFCLSYSLNEAPQIKSFLVSPHNRAALLAINGIGHKTVDYLLKLLNVDIVAIDRHIFSFVEQAGIPSNDYIFVKSVVEYAADIMNVSRRAIDFSIWSYMSDRNQNPQLSFPFY